MLFGARALQGAFAAVMAPAALSLLTVTFTEPRERARAFGVYGAIAGGGAAIGLVLGGTLTQLASWRWTLLINVPIAVARGRRPPSGSSARAGPRSTAGYDLPGAVTRHRRAVPPRLRVHDGRAPTAGRRRSPSSLLVGAARAPGRLRRRSSCASPHPLLPAAGRPRPQPRRLVPRLAARRVRHAWARSSSSPTSSRGRSRYSALQDRVRLPALLRRHHPRRRPCQPAPAADRAARLLDGRSG